ncbi:hypothetical protein G7046_g3592 [Stylonectria norvegica]|nr:hypothetical protein G7046_g3592 [Stylonectria norvegica]
MSTHGFLQYLRLKAIVSLICVLNYFGTRKHLTPSPSCIRKPVRIPSRQLGRFIDAWIYYPPKYDANEPRGVLVNWHGGAYILNNLGLDHAFLERVARETGLLVLDADYAKGPERPYPAAVEDAEDVLRWVESRPKVFDLERVAFSGFSSGGNLALVAASELRREVKGINVRAVYAMYPGTDWAVPPEEKLVAEPIHALPAWAQHVFADCYVPRAEDRTSPRASPMYAEAASFPAKVLVYVCSGDILAPEAEVFGQKLAKAGCGIEVVKVEGVGHGFDKTINPKLYNAEETEKAYAKVIASLKEVM